MKKYLPVITLAAAAYGVIFWLRKKAAAGQNLRYEIADIAIDIPKIIESRFARIFFNTKLRLINDESVSVNVKQINLNANVGNRQLGKILNNTPFTVPARSSNVVRIETSFSSGQIVLYIIDKIKSGFQFNDPISVNGFILTDLGRINVDYTKNPAGGITGVKKKYSLIGKYVQSNFRKEIGIIKKIEGDFVVIEYPSLGFTESVNYKLEPLTIVNYQTITGQTEHILNNIQGNC